MAIRKGGKPGRLGEGKEGFCLRKKIGLIPDCVAEAPRSLQMKKRRPKEITKSRARGGASGEENNDYTGSHLGKGTPQVRI